MDDALLMRVLDGLADVDEQLQALAGWQPVLVAVIGDRRALDQLHDEIGSPGADATGLAAGGAAIVYLGDIGMVQDRQGLPLGLETGDDLATVHAGLDD